MQRREGGTLPAAIEVLWESGKRSLLSTLHTRTALQFATPRCWWSIAERVAGYSLRGSTSGVRAAAHTILNRMRPPLVTVLLVQLSFFGFLRAQSLQPAFEVVSVRPSQHEVGPDYNNQIAYSPDGFTGRNVTLKRLIAEAWHCQINQVIGPPWLDHNEYDIEARERADTTRGQTSLMLRSLLYDRFHLKQHSDTRQMRVYDLTVGHGGARIRPIQPGTGATAGSGFHFRGDMRQFADLLAIQFSIPAADNPSVPARAGGSPIPVLDKTGLQGIYEFSVDLRPELGTDAFAAWKRVLEEQLGLKIESRKEDVAVVVVDEVARIPTAN